MLRLDDNDGGELPVRPGRAFLGLRVRGLGAMGVAAAMVVVAASLTPEPEGFGTHRGLGMPDCEYLMRTGWPCPGCGMTTSFALMARGRAGAALAAQPAGAALFVAVLAAGAAGAFELAGRRVWGVGRFRPRWWWGALAVATFLAGWGLKAGIGFLSGQFPLR